MRNDSGGSLTRKNVLGVGWERFRLRVKEIFMIASPKLTERSVLNYAEIVIDHIKDKERQVLILKALHRNHLANESLTAAIIKAKIADIQGDRLFEMDSDGFILSEEDFNIALEDLLRLTSKLREMNR